MAFMKAKALCRTDRNIGKTMDQGMQQCHQQFEVVFDGTKWDKSIFPELQIQRSFINLSENQKEERMVQKWRQKEQQQQKHDFECTTKEQFLRASVMSTSVDQNDLSEMNEKACCNENFVSYPSHYGGDDQLEGKLDSDYLYVHSDSDCQQKQYNEKILAFIQQEYWELDNIESSFGKHIESDNDNYSDSSFDLEEGDLYVEEDSVSENKKG